MGYISHEIIHRSVLSPLQTSGLVDLQLNILLQNSGRDHSALEILMQFALIFLLVCWFSKMIMKDTNSGNIASFRGFLGLYCSFLSRV
jgi:hypothetical protein